MKIMNKKNTLQKGATRSNIQKLECEERKWRKGENKLLPLILNTFYKIQGM